MLFERTQAKKRSMKNTMIKTYSQAIRLKAFDDRLRYLKLGGAVGEFTFNGHRILNQMLYRSKEWKRIRREAIIRDSGCDLADPDRVILDFLIVHHINPITIDDILDRRSSVFDLENLICCSKETHNAIHYGKDLAVPETVIQRTKNDTCPWRRD